MWQQLDRQSRVLSAVALAALALLALALALPERAAAVASAAGLAGLFAVRLFAQRAGVLPVRGAYA